MPFTLTPSRSYLIQRPKDKSDPDPKFGTVIFHIWPLMLLATLAHLTLLTCVAGLIGPYIFPALVIRFFVNLAALLLNWRLFYTRKEYKRESIELQPNIERNKASADEERQLLSKTILWCIPFSMFRVIHRSLLFEAIQEKKRSLLNGILETLTAIEVPKTKENTSDEAKEETHFEEVKLTIIEKEETDSENVSNILSDNPLINL